MPSVITARLTVAGAVGLLTALLLILTLTSPQPVAAAGHGDNAVDHVVVISVDGLTPRAIRVLGRDGARAFYRMLDHGTGTLNARTLRERTRTLPNHTGMVTGRRVRRAADGHGVYFNHDDGRTVHAAAGEHVASMFTVVHDRGGRTALYAAKNKFAFLDRSWNRRWGQRDRVGTDSGRDKIDRYLLARESRLVDALTRRLRRRPDMLSFLHLALPDHAGHAHGFRSEEYRAAVRQSGRQVGRVLHAIASRRYLRRHTVVILTADHGGRGRSHSDETRRADYTVPFLVWGATVARGADLYRINPHRRWPGSARTTYSGRQPVRNAEVANLATDLLDLPSVPGSQLNRHQGLQVAR